MTIAIGSHVRHKVFAHRGPGKVLQRGHTFLPSQTPKFKVGFERGGPLWCYSEDLIADVVARPGELAVAEHEPVVA